MQFRFLNILIFVFFYSACFPLQSTRDLPVHLIVDAGSSGSRFCPFEIEDAPSCELYESDIKCMKPQARTGLADLNQNEIESVISEGLAGLDSSYRNRIVQISVLGTGGFRKHSTGKQKKQIQLIAQAIQTTNHEAIIKVITGEQEAVYAWKSVGLKYRTKDHTILETGGATVQFAARNKTGNLQSISLPAGMNATSQKYSSLKEFQECQNEAPETGLEPDKAEQRLNSCVKLLISKKGPFQGLSSIQKTDRVYALGAPWDAIFHILETDKIDFDELKAAGIKSCSMNRDELIEWGVHPRFTDSNCYLFAYHIAQLKAAAVNTVHSARGSWPAGAAISGDVLGMCSDS